MQTAKGIKAPAEVEIQQNSQEARNYLFTGDIILLQCQLKAGRYEEAGVYDGDCGFVRGQGLAGEIALTVVPLGGYEDFHRQGYDPRDFLFQVAGQLNYSAQKDLRRHEKHLPQASAGSSQLAQLRLFQRRAEKEARDNEAILYGKGHMVRFGDIIQLRHIRTNRFVDIRGRMPAKLKTTARRVKLLGGALSSWMHLNPLYSHHREGEPVHLNEQVLFNSVKLGNRWDLSYSEHKNAFGDKVYEVSCCQDGRGFYPVLYGRSVIDPVAASNTTVIALTFGTPLRMKVPHHGGFVAGSGNLAKTEAYVRTVSSVSGCEVHKVHDGDHLSFLVDTAERHTHVESASDPCSKEVWVLETVALDFRLPGISFNETPVVLRHFASGRFLSISPVELVEKGILEETDIEEVTCFADLQRAQKLITTMGLVDEGERDDSVIRTELSDRISTTTVFYLEKPELDAMAIEATNALLVPRENAVVMIRWNHPLKYSPYWLSVTDVRKGKAASLKLCWCPNRYSRDALQLELQDNPWMQACDVIKEHCDCLRHDVLSKFQTLDNLKNVPADVELAMLGKIDNSLSDMIRFIADSLAWRMEKAEASTADALEEPLVAVSERQRLARELKYIDISVQLFDYIAQHLNVAADAFHAGDSSALRPGSVGLQKLENMRLRVLRLLVRTWSQCFLGHQKNKVYFYRKGFISKLDVLNGLGFGVSEVYTTLVDGNPELALRIGRDDVKRFLGFIRTIGPEPTWFSFLGALCYQQSDGGAIVVKQQTVLSELYQQGYRANETDRNSTMRNRKELLIHMRLGESIGMAVGGSGGNVPAQGECLGRDLLLGGVRDIALSWESPPHWQPGTGVLFHSPQVLGIPVLPSIGDGRKWVSMLHLVWVLEPQKCCEAATGMPYDQWLQQQQRGGVAESGEQSRLRGSRLLSQEETPGANDATVDLLKVLARYFLAQLEMLSRLARDCQMNSVMALQEEYSFTLCLSAASDLRLPSVIRASFYDLLCDIWLCRSPHVELAMPSMMRPHDPDASSGNQRDDSQVPQFVITKEVLPDHWTNEHLKSLSKEVLLFYRIRDHVKMEVLLQSMYKFLRGGYAVEQQCHDQHQDTMLMTAVIRAFRFCTMYGFHGSTQVLLEMTQILLRILDGRSDWLEKPADVVALAREQSEAANGSVTPMTPLLSGTNGAGGSNGQGPSTGFRPPPEEDSGRRWIDCDENVSLMRCKADIAETVLRLWRMGQHVQMTRIIKSFEDAIMNNLAFKAALDGTIANRNEIITSWFFAQGDNPMSLLGTDGSPGVVMCVDLLMYQDHDLFELGLELLFTSCQRTTELLQKLRQVSFLSLEQLRLFDELKDEIRTLGTVLLSFECWGCDGNFAADDSHRCLSQVKRVCAHIKNLCAMGDGKISIALAQAMISQTDFFQQFQTWTMMDSNDVTPSNRPLMLQITSLLCSAMASYVHANERNQAQVFAALPRLEHLLGEQTEACVLAAELFRGNLKLCQQAPSGLIEKMVELLVDCRQNGQFAPWYLSVLTAVVSVGVRPVTHSQLMVIDEMQRCGHEKILHLLMGESGLQRLVSLADGFRSEQAALSPISLELREADKELLYHLRCLELLQGLAKGREGQNLVSKPYVNSIFPVSAMMLLLTAPQFARHDPQVRNMRFSIHRHLKMKWLSLVHLLLYDVDLHILDLGTLASPLHARFLSTMLGWMLSVLQPVGEMYRSTSSSVPLGMDAEGEFLYAMLVCLDSFCCGPYTEVLLKTRCPEVAQAMQQFAVALEDLGPAVSRGARNCFNPKTASLLQMTACRVITATGGTPLNFGMPVDSLQRISSGGHGGSMASADMEEEESELITSAIDSERAASSRDLVRGQGTVAGFQETWNEMLAVVKSDPRVKKRIMAEDAEIGKVFARVEKLTDREHSSKIESMFSYDFRRAMIPMELVFKRLISHATTHLHSSMATLMRVLKAFIFLLEQARNRDPSSGDPSLQQTQMKIVNAGILTLINEVLSSKLTDEVDSTTWGVLYEVMKGDASSRVDKDLQVEITTALKSMNDLGMWDAFSSRLLSVGQQVKRIRYLQKLPALAPEEKGQIVEYSRQLRCAVKAMEAVRLMVEGHFFEMQQYLFIQDGNERSVCVPEMAGTLLMRVCKDQITADQVAHKDLQCLGYTLSLLTELTQGPNVRTQDFLSTLGLIETIFKLLNASFARLQSQVQDIYPRTVRRLKQRFMEALLALLEGRQDTKIHTTMLSRIDKAVLRDRLLFVFTYFIVGTASTKKGGQKERQGTIVQLRSPEAKFVQPDTDHAEVYDELREMQQTAEELLEDLDDQELDELLGEGLDVLQLVLNLKQHSKELDREVVPDGPPIFDHSLVHRTSEREFAHMHAQHRRQAWYYEAWTFLHRFVKTIEVVLDGQLHSLHFQQPLTAMWYVHGAAKDRILDNIGYQSPDLKAKSFCEMCIEVHGESQLIRRLSRFSIFPPGKVRQWAQRHLPDGFHRPFQVFLANDALLMQWMLRGSLVLGVALAICVGSTLSMKQVSYSDGDGSKQSGWKEVWISPIAQIVATMMGALHAMCTVLYLTLNACIKVPMQVEAAFARKEPVPKAVVGGVLIVLADAFFAWRLLLGAITISALLLHDSAWMYCLLVLDFFCQSASLLTVLQGIMAPGRMLLMVFLGSFIVTYVYAAIGFHYFRVEFGDYCSETIAVCAQNIMYQGTRSGIIGLSSMMTTVMPEDNKWMGRVVFDMSYFIVFGVMFLNTIVALIVDAFVSQRAEAEARASSLIGETFVSCIDRKVIDSAAQQQGIAKGFQHNEENIQNKWDYMSFIFYLREKEVDEYTGPEQHIRQLLENMDTRWMPINRSKLLEGIEGDSSARDDILVRIERQALHIISSESRTKHGRQAINRGVQGLSKKIDEKMDAAHACLEVLMEMDHQPSFGPSTSRHLSTRRLTTRKSVSASKVYGRM